MSEQKCSLPTCSMAAAGFFREMPLCRKHLEIAWTWEWCFGHAVRLPTMAELRQARDSVGFAAYAVDHFLKMNVKYGAIDFRSGFTAHQCKKRLLRLIRERNLKIWIFRRGATEFRQRNATLYLVREDLE